jgi:hypothetical protein
MAISCGAGSWNLIETNWHELFTALPDLKQSFIKAHLVSEMNKRPSPCLGAERVAIA